MQQSTQIGVRPTKVNYYIHVNSAYLVLYIPFEALLVLSYNSGK